MLRKSLLVATLLLVASPLYAQEDYVWTSKRPDGHAPVGILNGRTLEVGEAQVTYRFRQVNHKGVWFENDSLFTSTTLEFYQVAPLTLSNQMHQVSGAYAVSDKLTLTASWTFAQLQREQLTDGGVFYVTDVDEPGDVEVSGLFNFYDQGPYRAHLQMGLVLPIASATSKAETPFSTGRDPLPYDMRMGSQTFGILPGVTFSVQNEAGSVGAQANAEIHFGTNDHDFREGNRYMATGWAAYRAGDYFSVSARVRWENWGGIHGQDSRLDPTRDPGNDGFFLEGERVDLPVGVNFYMPEGTRFEGHRLALEAVFPVHHDYEGPQLGLDWGFTAAWQVAF